MLIFISVSIIIFTINVVKHIFVLLLRLNALIGVVSSAKVASAYTEIAPKEKV